MSTGKFATMSRLRILWLCSWYPSSASPYNGDFIQRHAKAAALYNDIHVIHVYPDDSGSTTERGETLNRSQGLTEQVICFPRKPGLAGALMAHFKWRAEFRIAVKKYISEYGKPDLVHVHIPVRAGLIGVWMKKKWGLAYILTEHWGIYNPVEKLNYAGRSFLFKHITKKVFRQTAAFVSVSRYLAEAVRKQVLPVDYTVIPNAVDTGLFNPRTTAKKGFRILHVSNMVPLKNVQGILRTFKELLKETPEARLDLIGNRTTEMADYASSLGLSAQQVQFHGEMSQAQVAAAMQESHVLVLFSDIENSPCVLAEAACCGLPVITTETGGIPELVNPQNGLLIRPGDELALLDAFRFVRNNPGVFDLEKIATAAHLNFSFKATGSQLDQLYRSSAL